MGYVFTPYYIYKRDDPWAIPSIIWVEAVFQNKKFFGFFVTLSIIIQGRHKNKNLIFEIFIKGFIVM